MSIYITILNFSILNNNSFRKVDFVFNLFKSAKKLQVSK